MRTLSRLAPALLALALVACTTYTPARADPCALPQADIDWSVSAPKAAGFDAEALCRVLREVAAGTDNIHALLVERRGVPVADFDNRSQSCTGAAGTDRSVCATGSATRSARPRTLMRTRSTTRAR